MKTIIQCMLVIILAAVSLQTYAQSTLVYDQQSATGPISPLGNGNVDGLYIQEDGPLYQSFIPTLSVMNFVQLEFEDVPNNGTNGATVSVALYSGSLNNLTLVSSTTPVYMPNGFVNNNLAVAGMTTFNFSTPITLIPGQNYYLEPFVFPAYQGIVSDNPWAIVTLIGSTYYPNGQLYVSDGGAPQPFVNPTNLWFREGILTVPEPSTLALGGLGSLLVFLRKRCRSLLLIWGLSVTTLAGASQVYYLQSMGGVGGGSPPFPMNPDSSVAVEEVSAGVYLVEDGSSGSSKAHAMADSAPPSFTDTNNDSGTNQTFQPEGGALMFDTNGLWLEASNEAPNLGLRLHNPTSDDNYQLLLTVNL